MLKQNKVYIFDEVSKKYFLRTQRKVSFMEPNTKYKLVSKDSIPKDSKVLRVKLKYMSGSDCIDLTHLQLQLDSLHIGDQNQDLVGEGSTIDVNMDE